MKACVRALFNSPDMRSLDVHLAQFAASLDSEQSNAVLVATALASRAVGRGDVCASLAECVDWADSQPEIDCPSGPSEWLAALADSRAVQPLDQDSSALLAVDEDRLYLMRYFSHEQFVAERLRAALADATGAAHLSVPTDRLRAGLDQLFPPQGSEPDWQRVAVAVALRQRMCVISGGPGTGKTRTVARLLCLLQHFSEQPLRMALAAPTGKAAARLAQSIQRELPDLQNLLPDAAALVPTEASTLHRLLGYRSSGAYRHNADNPLALDLLLVDEASMLDLAMMARLLAAIPAHAQLILLGDRDQLSSVEAGNVLGDICGDYFDCASAELINYLRALTEHAAEQLELSDNPVADGICLLRHSYRFDADSGVGAAAAAVNSGVWPAMQALLQTQLPDLRYLDPEHGGRQAVAERLLAHFKGLHQCESAEQALQQLSRFQLLCALRKGEAGVEQLNLEMAQVLCRAGLIGQAEQHRGRPIMVLENDYAQSLFNGDVGLLWPDADGNLQAWFNDSQGELRAVLPARLPAHESCYAMTVHKTQGSEFNEVCIVLPDKVAAIFSRQLLYTAVTRARESVTLCGPQEVIKHMVQTGLQRQSGLQQALASTANAQS